MNRTHELGVEMYTIRQITQRALNKRADSMIVTRTERIRNSQSNEKFDLFPINLIFPIPDSEEPGCYPIFNLISS